MGRYDQWLGEWKKAAVLSNDKEVARYASERLECASAKVGSISITFLNCSTAISYCRTAVYSCNVVEVHQIYGIQFRRTLDLGKRFLLAS
jgi:hypothetical protein